MYWWGRGIEGGFEPPLELAQGEVPLYDLKGTLVGRYRYDGGVPDTASPATGKNASLSAYRSVEGGNLKGKLPSAGIRP